MHIAASKPKALDSSGVAAELLDTERRIAIEKAREAGKPEAMLEKIAEGTVQKYLKDVTLLGQVFVKAEDGKQTIEAVLKTYRCFNNASIPRKTKAISSDAQKYTFEAELRCPEEGGGPKKTAAPASSASTGGK